MNLDTLKYLFWDVDFSTVNTKKHCRFIIERVIKYGELKDWHYIKQLYGLDIIKKEVTKIRTLDKKTLNLMSVYFNIPKEKFRCYTQTQSNQTHWNY